MLSRSTMNRVVMLFCVAESLFATAKGAPPPTSPERWDRVVFLCTESAAVPSPAEKPKRMACTGFLVTLKGRIFLATARHGADDTLPATKVSYRAVDGDSRWVPLRNLSRQAGDPWTHHPKADLAVMPLATEKFDAITRTSFQAMAFPAESFPDTVPQRTTPLEVAGFPMAVGSYETISPIVSRLFLASGEVAVPGKWENERFLLAVPAVARGYSGAPVLVGDADPKSVRVIGVYVGAMADDSGAKLSKVVPVRLLRETLDRAP